MIHKPTFKYMFMSHCATEVCKCPKFNLQINKHYIETTPSDGINLIGHISKQKEILERPRFGSDDKEFLNKFPQYNSVWRWEEQLKIGFVLACDLPNYDAEANKELGQIISVLN